MSEGITNVGLAAHQERIHAAILGPKDQEPVKSLGQWRLLRWMHRVNRHMLEAFFTVRPRGIDIAECYPYCSWVIAAGSNACDGWSSRQV